MEFSKWLIIHHFIFHLIEWLLKILYIMKYDVIYCTRWPLNSCHRTRIYPVQITLITFATLNYETDYTDLDRMKVCLITGTQNGVCKSLFGVVVILNCRSRIDDVGERASYSPILVVCYTNHALDQFLTEIAKFTQKIVRLGGGSKNEELKKFSLRYSKPPSTLES